MNKTFWISVAGYFFATMAVAYPWHMLLFHEQYMAMGAFTRGEPIMPFGMLAVVVQGMVFAYFFPLFLAQKCGAVTTLGGSIKRGIQFSLFLGLTVYTVMVFATAAKFKIEPVADFVLFGTAFQLLQFLLVGVVLGVIHNRFGARP